MAKNGAAPHEAQALLAQLLGIPRSSIDRIPAQHLRGLLTGLLLIAEKRRTKPDATTVLVNPTDVPGLNRKALLKRLSDLRRGKPIEHLVDFCDRSASEVISIPALDSTDVATSRPVGRPRRPISTTQVQRMRKRYPDDTHFRLAQRLEAETGQRVTKDLVRRRLREARGKSSTAKKSAAKSRRPLF
jgi:hypothetical protein